MGRIEWIRKIMSANVMRTRAQVRLWLRAGHLFSNYSSAPERQWATKPRYWNPSPMAWPRSNGNRSWRTTRKWSCCCGRTGAPRAGTSGPCLTSSRGNSQTSASCRSTWESPAGYKCGPKSPACRHISSSAMGHKSSAPPAISQLSCSSVKYRKNS